jgi:hypothetical protein
MQQYCIQQNLRFAGRACTDMTNQSSPFAIPAGIAAERNDLDQISPEKLNWIEAPDEA